MKKIYIVSGIISYFFTIFGLVFIVILPLMGIYFSYNSQGTSMEPALINPVTIRLSPERAPYEDLQVGDIILFREIDFPENNTPPGTEYIPEWNKDHTKLQFVRQSEAEISIEYINVMHRIIAINENGLVTKGDNNEDPDIFPVKAGTYQGKIVWHMNHINWLFKAMYQYGLWLVLTIVYFVISILQYKKASALISEQKDFDTSK